MFYFIINYGEGGWSRWAGLTGLVESMDDTFHKYLSPFTFIKFDMMLDQAKELAFYNLYENIIKE